MLSRDNVIRRCTTLVCLFGLLIPGLRAHATIYYVSPTGNDSNTGKSWATAKATVNGAVSLANTNDQIWVAAGTYLLTASISLPNNVALYGGFSGSETALSQRNYATNVTVIDGNNNTVTPLVQSPQTAGLRTRIDGFTFQHAGTSGSNKFTFGTDIQFGGTITIANNTFNELSATNTDSAIAGGSASTVMNVQIVNNTVIGSGIGLYLSNNFANCMIASNTFQNCSSGGVAIQCSTISFTGNTMTDCGFNSTSLDFNYDSLYLIVNNGQHLSECLTFTGNTLSNNAGVGAELNLNTIPPFTGTVANNTLIANGAGGLRCRGPFVIKDNLIAANTTINQSSSSTQGAGIYIQPNPSIGSNNLVLTNNTIVDNVAGSATGGGGVWFQQLNNSSYTIANNLVAFNTSGFGTDGSTGSATFTLATNDVFGSDFDNYDALTPGATDLSLDPLFVDHIGGNYHLTSLSPCIDAGTDGYVSAGDIDLDGNPRIYGAHVDIGAYEWIPSAYPDLASLVISPSTLCGGQPANLLVTLTSVALPTGAIVQLTSSNPALPVPATLTVPGSNASALITVTASAVITPQTAVVTASYLGITKTVTVTVKPLIASLTFSPSIVVGGTSAAGTITLNTAAPSAFTVTLQSSDPSVSVTNVPVSAGATSATFTASTTSVTTVKSVTITATSGVQTLNTTLIVDPAATLKSLVITPTTITGGLIAVGVVTLTAAAPTGGVMIPITDSSPSTASAPTMVTVPAGKRSINFAIPTTAVSASTPVTFTSALGGVTKTAKLTVQPATIAALTLVPSNVEGGENSIGIVTLSMPATSPVTVTLSGGSIASPDVTTIVIPTGALQATFNISTVTVTKQTTATIQASVYGVAKKATLTLTP